MLKKFGPANLSDHYAEFDTICDATQVNTYLDLGLDDICKYWNADYIYMQSYM